MHLLSGAPPARFAVALVVLSGVSVGAATIGIAKAALVERASDPPSVTLEVTHLPPLLTLPGEEVPLDYEAFCVRPEPADGRADSEEPCDVTGSVFIRPASRGEFSELPLARSSAADAVRLSVDVPVALMSSNRGFSYFAVLRAPGASPLTIPAGGAAAPHVSAPLLRAVHVDLGAHVFGAARRADQRAATAAWGSGPNEVGLEPGGATTPIGASAFDVDAAGTVFLLDEVHRRVLRWARNSSHPERIPVSVTGTLADMAVAPDESIFVLETVGRAGGTPLVRRFDGQGRDLDVTEAAERTVSQIRIGPHGPVVLQQPSHQWMPMTAGGAPASDRAQRRGARLGRPLSVDGEVVLLRLGREIRVALTDTHGLRRAWRVTSETEIAEVQLAEPLGSHLVLVARVYTDGRDEFVVLLLGAQGLVRQFSLDPADWAEAAPLGRFKLVDSSLYRLGSTPAAAFVDRFDLEVR